MRALKDPIEWVTGETRTAWLLLGRFEVLWGTYVLAVSALILALSWAGSGLDGPGEAVRVDRDRRRPR
jgi:hypothetical protein